MDEDEDLRAQREATLRKVVEWTSLGTGLGVVLILPLALAAVLAASGRVGWWVVVLFPTAILVSSPTMHLMRAIGLRILVEEPITPWPLLKTMVRELFWLTAVILCGGGLLALLEPYRVSLGLGFDGIVYGAILLPSALGGLWRSGFRWRRIRNQVEVVGAILVGVLTGSGFAWNLGSLVQSGAQPGFTMIPLQLLFMPLAVGVAIMVQQYGATRRLLRLHLAGAFQAALDEAAAQPWFIQALVLLDSGDQVAAQILLDANPTDETSLRGVVEGLLLAEAGRHQEAWEQLRSTWERHPDLHDVMIAAQGLEVGADVHPLLDAFEAHHRSLPERLLTWDPTSAYAACRAWAFAAEGKVAEARVLLVDEPPLPMVLQTERDYLRARALRALGDPTWRSVAERGAAGAGRCARLCRGALDADGE